MYRTLMCVLLLRAPSVLGQVDTLCQGTCQTITVQRGIVRLVDKTPPGRTLTLGKHVLSARRLVPLKEALIRDMQSPHGWRIVVSVFLDHDSSNVTTRLRIFFNSSLQVTSDLLMMLVYARIAVVEGGELFAITTEEEHSYNDATEIWYLPQEGTPTKVLDITGSLDRFDNHASTRNKRRISVFRQTYDGVHPETKGVKTEYYVWNREQHKLVVATQ